MKKWCPGKTGPLGSHHPMRKKKIKPFIEHQKTTSEEVPEKPKLFQLDDSFFYTGKGLFNETSVLNWLFGFQVGTNQGCLLEVSVNDDHSNHLEQTPNSKKHKTI